VSQQVIVHTVLSSTRAGLNAGPPSLSFGALVSQRTPLGSALDLMLHDAARKLYEGARQADPGANVKREGDELR
jgi:hypothetical protein